jgi:hypothetical protein
MARMPTPAPADEDDTGPDPMGDPDAGGAPADDTGAADEAEETVLCTVTKKADGTYMVYKGDEPEEGDEGDAGGEGGGAADEGTAGGGEGGAGVAGMAPGGEEGAPQGQAYDSVSATLHAVMTILHDDENGGEGGAEGAFQAGFGAGDQGGATTPPPLAQKY